MPTGRDEANAIIKTYKVGATAVLPHRFVRSSTKPAIGQDGTVIHCADGTDILGVSYVPYGYEERLKYGQATPTLQADPGQAIDVVLLGSSATWQIQLGAALAEGTIVTSNASGQAIALAAAVPATPTFCFRLLEGGGINSYRPILLCGFIRG